MGKFLSINPIVSNYQNNVINSLENAINEQEDAIIRRMRFNRREITLDKDSITYRFLQKCSRQEGGERRRLKRAPIAGDIANPSLKSPQTPVAKTSSGARTMRKAVLG